MYLLGKILGIGLACTVPVAVATSSYLGGASQPKIPLVLKLEKDNDFEENCYILETKDSNTQKLLVCENPSDFSSVYYLFKKGGVQKTYTKATSVIKKQGTDHFVVKLVGETGAGMQLQANGQEWKDFQEEMNLTSQNKCQLRHNSLRQVMGAETTSLFCSSRKSDWVSKEITLKPFKVNE
ncbi:hypothetical protein DNK47_03225 [Mycoplasma wenyonii]|uniref:Uncharacterized protein n=1 Tax=Mycoplasma wenyonii TaxID=65123 RepID=A0A328PTH5_9MOLU|nr:hypothetical protein [Mycoplasma wenyonii]RAO94771.1 hypothetical protein DNK47_03225 [Mycoplasma wenyonii]